MKQLLFILLLQIPVLLFAQDRFILEGKVSSSTDGKKIYLVHLTETEEKIDSTFINKGKFHFSIALKEPAIGVLILDHQGKGLNDPQSQKDLFRLFIEPGKASLTATDSISKSIVKGLKVFEEQAVINQIIASSDENLNRLNIEFSALSPAERNNQGAKFQERFFKLVAERESAIKAFVNKHPKSFVSLYYLNNQLAHEEMNIPEIQAIYDRFPENLQNTVIGKMLKQKLEQGKITGIGVVATDFEEKTPEGIAVKLSSYRGQYVLVDFWASWCTPCRQENPFLVKAYEKYKNKGFSILGVSIDKNADAWKKAIKADGLIWVQLLDTTQEIAKLYGIDSIPKNYLLDKEGKIIAKNLRGAQLDEKLKEIFK